VHVILLLVCGIISHLKHSPSRPVLHCGCNPSYHESIHYMCNMALLAVCMLLITAPCMRSCHDNDTAVARSDVIVCYCLLTLPPAATTRPGTIFFQSSDLITLGYWVGGMAPSRCTRSPGCDPSVPTTCQKQAVRPTDRRERRLKNFAAPSKPLAGNMHVFADKTLQCHCSHRMV